MASMWENIRKDFPILTRYTYLNAAAVSPTSPPVRKAVRDFYQELDEGGDSFWEEWISRQEKVRKKVAAFIGATPDEIAFVPNTSTGLNLVIDLLGKEGAVLSDSLEFPTVTLPWIHRNIPVHFIGAQNGIVPVEAFRKENAPLAKILALSHVQFSNGCRQDLNAFSAIKEDRYLVISASQSAGVFPIDVKKNGIDALASAGHKWLCAGFSAGFLYISQKLLETYAPHAIGWLSVENPFTFDNRQYKILSSNRRVEAGCPGFVGAFALGAAIEYLNQIGIDSIEKRTLSLNTYLTDQLQREGFEVLSPGGKYRSAETLCILPDPPLAKAFLQKEGVMITEKPEGIRIATHFYNNEQDIEVCIKALKAYRNQKNS